MLEKPKLRLYRTLKNDLHFEDYLTEIADRRHRSEFARIRGGTHDLKLETDRYKKADIEVEKRVCLICAKGAVEDESHLLLDCIL